MKIEKYKVTIELKEKVKKTEIDFLIFESVIQTRRDAINCAENWRDVLKQSKDEGDLNFDTHKEFLRKSDYKPLNIRVEVFYSNGKKDIVYYPLGTTITGTWTLVDALNREACNYNEEGYDSGGDAWRVNHPKKGDLLFLQDDFETYHNPEHPVTVYLKSIPDNKSK